MPKKKREQEAEELKQLENELKKSGENGEDETVDDTESSESQEAGKVNNVDLHKVMGVPKDAKGVSAAVAVKLRSKADVSSHLSRVFLIRQLWIVNYHVKSSSNNFSYENIKTDVSREMIFKK